MDPRYCAQDVIRCDLCETPIHPMYCDICHIKLCKTCVGDHLSDRSTEHKVLPFEQRGSTINYPKCQSHSAKNCELHCDDCNSPICALCISSGEHDQHIKQDILKSLEIKKTILQKDFKELKNYIYPNYQETALNIPVQKADLRERSQELKTALEKQGKSLHAEIDVIIQGMHSQIDYVEASELNAIDKQEQTINHTLDEISQVILDLQKLLVSGDFCLVSAYKSRNEEFKKLPQRPQLSLITFTPHEINREQIYQQFGCLSKQTIPTEEDDCLMNTQDAVYPTPDRSLFSEPQFLRDITTEHGSDNSLLGISCLNDNEFWLCGKDMNIRLYNLQGELLKSIQTNSENWPGDIEVTHIGQSIYTDNIDSSINVLSNTQIEPLIKLRGWNPRNLCSTPSGELLVTMDNHRNEQAKVVRYYGSTEKQNIQWDDQGLPLYSTGYYKYLSENRNLDICVADYAVGAVVVVSASGKLRFRYTGPPRCQRRFYPADIITDSQSRILTSDPNNHRIHILDVDGRFLRFINNYGLHRPWGLCVNSEGSLFVAEYGGKVKQLKYC